MKQIKIRDAENADILPAKMKHMQLVGSYNNALYIAAENTEKDIFGPLVIYGYDLKENSIKSMISVEGGWHPLSWKQSGNNLYIGTRSGKLVKVDLSQGKQKSKKFENGIDCISANEKDVYFGVNGQGIYKCKKNLTNVKKKETNAVVSAIELMDDNLILFYFSNGNDPFLGNGPAGGLVTILDNEFKKISENNTTPYAVTQAQKCGDKIRFSTRDTSNGNVRNGHGALYELDPESLKYKRIIEFPAAVNSLYKNGFTIAGLKNGAVYNEHAIQLHKQNHDVVGMTKIDKKLYIGSPDGTISVCELP